MKKLTLHKQHGFALIDVLVATIVLSIGAIAFVKLSNISMNRSKESNFNTQATSSANALIELARSNSRLVAEIINNRNKSAFIASKTTSNQQSLNCSGTSVDANDKSTWCSHDGTKILDDLYNRLQAEFSKNFDYAQGRAILCLNSLEPPVSRPFDVRVSVIWKLTTAEDSGPAFNPALITDCPTSYSSTVANTADTLNPDRGYFEIYTRI